ncbi:MAG TPA: hypothetical protein VF331_27260 [Polyangiales bacterium]
MQGGPGSCKDTRTWQSYASEDCAQRGQVLATLSFSTPCGGGSYTDMSYDCCTQP